MKYLKYIIYILIAAFIVGCQNDSFETPEDSQNLEARISIQKYFKLMRKANTPGTILLQNRDYVGNQFNKRNVFISQRTEKNELNKSSNKISLLNSKGIKVNIGDLKNRGDEQDLTQLYGSNVNLIDESIQNRGPGDSSEVYVPELINVDVQSEFLEAGAEISWNVDELNENGVLVSVLYDPKSQPDAVIGYNNQQRIAEAYVIEDASGSYVLTDEDLQRFPEDALITLTVGRGAFAVDENDNTKFVAITKVSDDIKVKK